MSIDFSSLNCETAETGTSVATTATSVRTDDTIILNIRYNTARQRFFFHKTIFLWHSELGGASWREIPASPGWGAFTEDHSSAAYESEAENAPENAKMESMPHPRIFMTAPPNTLPKKNPSGNSGWWIKRPRDMRPLWRDLISLPRPSAQSPNASTKTRIGGP